MRNKKYRCWKLILCLIVLSLLDFTTVLLVQEKLEKILLIVCGIGIMLICFILFPLYLEVKDDRIVTRLGTQSLNKEYRGSFKKHVFMIDDLRDIYIENKNTIHLTLKGEVSVTFQIQGFFNKNKLYSLINEVRAQIKGYEQNY